MNGHEELGWDDDIRALPRRLQAQAGSVPAERIASAWERELRRLRIPKHTQVRWEREPSGKHGVKGALRIEGGLPLCAGFTVVVRGRPHYRSRADGTLGRRYPTYQRRALKDGTALHTIAAAWAARAELEAEVEELERTAAMLGGGRRRTETGAGSERESGMTPSAGLRQVQASLRTRGGAALAGVPARHYTAEERTLGAVIARMESTPLATTKHTHLQDNKLIAERVLEPGTRLDLVTAAGMQYIYDELGSLHKLHIEGSRREEWTEEEQLISSGRRNNLWKSFKVLLDYAQREGWLEEVAGEVKREASVNRDEVKMLSRAETLRLEHYAVTLANVAREAARNGMLPVAKPTKGRIWERRSWTRLQCELTDPNGEPGEIDVRAILVGGIPVVHLGRQSTYFATGLAAYVLLATTLAPRPGELSALCWHSVDLERGVITWERRLVSPQYQAPGSVRRYIAEGTKNSRGDRIVRRRVHMTERIQAALRDWRAERAELRLAMGWQIPEADAGGLVFPSMTGRVLINSSARHLWKTTQRAAGVTVTRPHAVRHAVATQHTLAKVNPCVTSAVLGNSVAVLMKNYVQPLEEMPAEYVAIEEEWRTRLQQGRQPSLGPREDGNRPDVDEVAM